MGKRFDSLTEEQIAFIGLQPVFFVATVPLPGGHVNLSPKGMDSLRVLSPARILWLNVTGSGNETAPHPSPAYGSHAPVSCREGHGSSVGRAPPARR